jgi:hypothetical protein
MLISMVLLGYSLASGVISFSCHHAPVKTYLNINQLIVIFQSWDIHSFIFSGFQTKRFIFVDSSAVNFVLLKMVCVFHQASSQLSGLNPNTPQNRLPSPTNAHFLFLNRMPKISIVRFDSTTKIFFFNGGMTIWTLNHYKWKAIHVLWDSKRHKQVRESLLLQKDISTLSSYLARA